MKDERASEILRQVFYANFGYMPDCERSQDAFYVGRMGEQTWLR